MYFLWKYFGMSRILGNPPPRPFLLRISTSLGVGLGVRVMPARMRGSYAGLGLDAKEESLDILDASLRGGYKLFE